MKRISVKISGAFRPGAYTFPTGLRAAGLRLLVQAGRGDVGRDACLAGGEGRPLAALTPVPRRADAAGRGRSGRGGGEGKEEGPVPHRHCVVTGGRAVCLNRFVVIGAVPPDPSRAGPLRAGHTTRTCVLYLWVGILGT